MVENLIRRLRRFFAKRGQELSESPPLARVLKKFLDSSSALVHEEPFQDGTFPEGCHAAAAKKNWSEVQILSPRPVFF